MFWFLILTLFAPLVFAELPDAGTLLREEQSLPPAFQAAPLLTEEPTPSQSAKTSPDTTERINVEQFKFIGHFPEDLRPTLHALTNFQLHQKLSLQDLENLCHQLSLALQKKGFSIVKTSIPPQEIENGIITLQIFIAQIDTTYNGFELAVIGIKRSNPDKISTLMINALCPETTCNTPIFLESPRLERGILLVNDLPGISGNLLLEPGQRTGATRVVVQAHEAPLLMTEVSFDNYGNPYSGLFRRQGGVSLNSPFGWTDQLKTQITVADRLFYGNLQYDFPLGSYGTRSQITYNNLHYSLGKDFIHLEAQGDAKTLRATIRHPIVRQRNRMIMGELHTEKKYFWDYSLGVETSYKNLRSSGLSLNMTQRDQYGHGGINTFNLSVDTGFLSTNQTLAGTASSFTKWQFSAARNQQLLNHTSAYVSLYEQRTQKNLDSSEKMSLGGPQAVRAYPVNTTSGNEGIITTFEIHQNLLILSPSHLQLIGFFDKGTILSPHCSLQGAGLALQIYHPKKASARLTMAQAIGSDARQFWLQGYIEL